MSLHVQWQNWFVVDLAYNKCRHDENDVRNGENGMLNTIDFVFCGCDCDGGYMKRARNYISLSANP